MVSLVLRWMDITFFAGGHLKHLLMITFLVPFLYLKLF